MSDTLIATIGSSAHPDPTQAGREAAETAQGELSSLQPRLAIVFGSSWFNQEALLQGVHTSLGSIPIVGESTAGEILSEGPTSHSCIVVLLASHSLTFSIGMGEEIHQTPRKAGQRAAHTAMREFPGGPRAGCLLFGDGLVTGYADVVRGVQEVLGTEALIVGGMAGDDFRLLRTSQYFNGRVLTHAVVALLLGRPFKIGTGIEHGFAPISRPRQVTRAQANILYELDQQPAAAVYEEYFGHDLVQQMQQDGLTRQGIAYPLGLQGTTADQWLLRNVLSFGTDGSLRCSGEILEGAWLQLMMGSRELAIDAARRAAQQAIRSVNRVACVLLFDSVVRRRLLGPRHAAMEIASIRETIGPSIPLAGCYTYGEHAPADLASSSLERIGIQTGSILVVALGV